MPEYLLVDLLVVRYDSASTVSETWCSRWVLLADVNGQVDAEQSLLITSVCG